MLRNRTGRWMVMAVLAACLGTGSVVAGPVAVAAIFVAGLVAAVAWHWRGWRAVFAITLLLLSGAASSQPVIAEGTFWLRYVAAAILVGVTWGSPGGRTPWPLARGTKAILLSLWSLAVLALISTVWSTVPAITLQQSIALLLLAAFTHGVVLRRWRDTTTLTADMTVAVVVLGMTLAVGFVMAFMGVPGARSVPSGRLQGFYVNPNAGAMVAALVVCLAFGLWRETRRLMFLGFAVVAVTAILAAGTRTAALAIVASASWSILRTGTRALTKAIAASGVGLVVLWSAVPDVAAKRVAVLDRPAGSDVFSGRSVAWQVALDLWRQKSLAGHGYRSGEVIFANTHAVASLNSGITAAHSSFLQVLLELGILGIVPVLAAVAWCAVAVMRAPMLGIHGGMVAAIVAALIIMLAESSMLGTGNVFPWIFWPAAAALAAYPQLGVNGTRERGHRAVAGSMRRSSINRRESSLETFQLRAT